VAIVGPTSVGKTALALRLAPILDAEIVCADSRQVYRYLDIGTGKPTASEQAGAPHHLLDVVAPDEHFDAVEFSCLAREAIRDVTARGRRVIICGGTGLYVRALLKGLFPGPKADPEVRARLGAEEKAGGPGFLHRRLAACDPAAAARIHPNDSVRLIRALEVHELTGRPLSELQRSQGHAPPPCVALTIGLWREREQQRAAITARCAAMVAEGLVEEVRGLWMRGYGPDLAPLRTLGYRHMGVHLKGEQTLDEALAAMTVDTCQYAKRQLTWFRADPDCRWYHAGEEQDAAVAAAQRFVEGADR
jgi:tRNA dimethylallyltransferase